MHVLSERPPCIRPNSVGNYLASLILAVLLVAFFLFSFSAQARLVFTTNDGAFQNATIVTLDSSRGFAAGVQSVQLTEDGIDFDFTTANANGLSGFGLGLTSFFPEGVTVTFSQPMGAIGFLYGFAECSGQARFIGTAATEEHTFQQGQGGIFVGATDIGDITSVELNGTCFAASWSEMRFDATVLPPPTDQADLVFDKSAPAGASQLDGSLEFDLTVTNTGPDDARGVQFTDFPPGGMQVVASTPSQPLVSAGGKVVVVGVGDVVNGDQFSNTLTMSLPPFEGIGVVTQHPGTFSCNTQLLNIALATGSSVDPDTSNNEDLTVTRFDKASRFGTPEICNNAIDDNCNGRVDCGDSACAGAPNCRPPQLLNANNNPPQTCNVVGGVVICLNGNGPQVFPIGPAPVPAPPPPQACELKDVHGQSFAAPACCCSYGPCDRERCERLKVSLDPNFKTASPPVSSNGYGITQAGQLHEYTITYENIGEADAIDVSIYDVLAPELDETTLQINDGGEFDLPNRTIIWRDPLLPPQQPRTVSFSINTRVDLQPGDRVRNQATIIFPNAEQPRTDTNWVEHAIEDPDFPAAADLGVVECLETSAGSGQYTVVLFNKGTAFAHNASAQVINPPVGINFSADTVRFGRSDDTDPSVVGTVVPLGSTHSIDTVAFTTDTPASVCKALTWRISYTSSDGDDLVADVQAAPDSDEDGVADIDDNCVSTANLDQRDSDGDGQGDACETVVPSQCGDLDGDTDVDSDDRALFVSALRSVSGDENYLVGADLDADDDVDFSDYQQWYQCYQSYRTQL